MDENINDCLPTIHNLMHFRMDVGMYAYRSDVMIYFLGKAPILESLEIFVEFHPDHDWVLKIIPPCLA